MGAAFVLEDLLETSQQDQGHLGNRISEVPASDRAALAAEARAAANAFAERGDAARAEAAFRLAMGLSESVHAWPQTVEAGVRCADMMKFRAETVEEYERARQFALAMADPARQMRLADVAFVAHHVAADSAYFVAQVWAQQREFVRQDEWLLSAARDVVGAMDVFEVGRETPHSVPFVSLLGALASELPQRYWSAEGADAEIRAILRRIALCVESLVPIELPMLDPGRVVNLAHAFGALSYRYGSPEGGRTRLTATVEQARERGDLGAFMSASAARYEGERGSYRLSATLRELRDDFWAAAEAFREAPPAHAPAGSTPRSNSTR